VFRKPNANYGRKLEMSGTRPVAPNAFLNGTNYQKITGFLRDKYAKTTGGKLPEKADERIQKVVQHYMEEVSRIQGGKPISTLTQEVLRESTRSMDDWFKKQATTLPSPITTVGAFPKVEDDYSRLYADTGTNLERLMNERAPPPAAVPSVPDFRTTSDMLESNEDPVILMQRLQKQREEQMRAMGAQPAVLPAPATGPATVSASPRLEIRDDPAPTANKPTPPQADFPPPLLAPRSQDYIIPQEDVVKYIETEYNIFITSSDRDWLRNTSENRYNFTVNFNTAPNRNGFTFSPAVQNRFRNISRIEFVKAIVPIEAVTALVRVPNSTPGSFDTSRVVNIFSFPFAGVRIAELNNNGFSTKPEEDNTFAIVQYDTTWSSDLTVTPAYNGTVYAPNTKSGYTGLIPKFLKTQKVYNPTPLATLQRLSIRLERHNGELINDSSDVQFISSVGLAWAPVGTYLSQFGNADGTNYVNSSGGYIFIKTSNYFLYSAVGEGDLINLQGFSVPATSSYGTNPGDATNKDFETWMNRNEGHYVVATGVAPVTGPITLNPNSVGYCNLIIIRSRFDNPISGSTGRTSSYFGGSTTDEQNLGQWLNGSTAPYTGTGLINTSRQTHVVIRIITRDVDSSSNIRPDNV
jgi:hypothetical protein